MLEELKQRTIEEQLEILFNENNLKRILEYTDKNQFEDYLIGILKNYNSIPQNKMDKFDDIYVKHICNMIDQNSNYLMYMLKNYNDVFKKYLPKIYSKNASLFKNLSSELIEILMENKFFEFINVLSENVLINIDTDKIINAIENEEYHVDGNSPDYIKNKYKCIKACINILKV